MLLFMHGYMIYFALLEAPGQRGLGKFACPIAQYSIGDFTD